MRALGYACREGWTSLWRSRGSSALAVVAIGLAMLVLGALLLLTTNIERLLTRWSSASEFSVYLREDATSEQRGAIETAIDESGVSGGREFISKSEALTRFRSDFASLASLTADFDDNPFPASVEVQVRADAERNGQADAVVRRLATLPGVADVRYDREWLARLSGGLTAIQRAGLALAILMALAAAVTVASVVRLGLHNRRDEIQVMQLVGSPMSFLRGPFVAEGVMQGGLGSMLALLFLWLGFAVALAWWGGELTHALDGHAIAFLPLRLCLALVAGGMAVGAAGGYAASRHATL